MNHFYVVTYFNKSFKIFETGWVICKITHYLRVSVGISNNTRRKDVKSTLWLFTPLKYICFIRVSRLDTVFIIAQSHINRLFLNSMPHNAYRACFLLFTFVNHLTFEPMLETKKITNIWTSSWYAAPTSETMCSKEVSNISSINTSIYIKFTSNTNTIDKYDNIFTHFRFYFVWAFNYNYSDMSLIVCNRLIVLLYSASGVWHFVTLKIIFMNSFL